MPPLHTLKGVGPKTEALFARLGIIDTDSLIHYYPRTYDIYEAPAEIRSLEESTVAAITATVTTGVYINKVRNLQVVTTTVADQTGRLPVTWFNMPFLRNQLKMGTRYLFRGKVEKRNGRLQMVQPKRYTRHEFYKIVGKMQPIYPLTAGITNHAMAKLMQEAITEVEDFKEFLPGDLRKRQQLLEYKKAMR